MAKGITNSCANIWRSVARAGGWWSVLRLTRDWSGIYSLDEVAEHLSTLKRYGFLEAMETRRDGTVFGFTTKCLPLPGEKLVAVTQPAGEQADPASVATTPHRERDDMAAPRYVPPRPSYRADALDYQQVPSLHMGQRRAYRSAP